MKSSGFIIKILITIIPISLRILYEGCITNTCCMRNIYSIIIMIAAPVLLHIISNIHSKNDKSFSTYLLINYLETAIFGIVMYDIPSACIWIVLPLFSLSETMAADRNRSFFRKQSLFLLIISIIAYSLRLTLAYILPHDYSPVTDFITFVCAISIILITLNKMAASNEFMGYLLTKTKDNSLRDGHTHLYNRNALKQKIEKALLNIGGVSVIMMDIDNFKRVNDTYGHVFGDECLKNLARILESIESSQITAFRYGGEEFMIICTSISEQKVFDLAEDVRKEFSDTTYEMEDKTVSFTVSLGMVHSKYKEYETAELLIKDSDFALYEAKHTGKNKVVIYNAKEADTAATSK